MALQYNLSKVYEISENDIDFATQVVKLFLEEVPNELNSIKVAISEKDFHRAYTCAHKIKPSLDLLGMDMAYDENILIMEWAKSEGLKKEVKEIFKSLNTRVALAIKELKKDFNIS